MMGRDNHRIKMPICVRGQPVCTGRAVEMHNLIRHDVRNQFFRKIYSFLANLLSCDGSEIGQLRKGILAFI